MTMKVLQVIDYLNVGGAEKMLVNISNKLHNNMQNLAVLLIAGKGDLFSSLDSEILTHQLNRKSKFDIKAFKQLKSILKEYDIIHVHLKHNYRYVALCNLYFKLNKKIILHDHSHSFGISTFSLKSLKNYTFKNLLKPKYYIGVSKENCDYAMNTLKLPKSNVFLLNNFIVKQKVTENILPKKGIILVSNISKIKNISFALKFAKSVGKNLTIFGKIYDKEYFKELLDEVKELSLQNQVTFIHDEINIQQRLHEFEFGIFTSFKETGPLVLIEYIAQGLPFVAHKTGQVSTTIAKELPQFFQSDFNIEDWKKQLDQIKKVTSQQIISIYNIHFNTDNYIKKCQSIYQKIINS